MCSPRSVAPEVSPVQEMAALVAAHAEVAERMAELTAAGVFAQAEVGLATQWSEQILRAADRASAVGTVGVGVVDRSTALIAGRYVSAARWVERTTRTSGSQAAATASMARDLTGDYGVVQAAWLDGAISRAGARELTVEVRRALRAVPGPRRDVEREQVLATLLPLARRESVADLSRAVARLRFVLDPDGATQAALDAYDDQTLSVAITGPSAHLSLWTTAETAAALLTVLDQQVSGWFRDGSLPAEEQVDHDADGTPRPTRGRRGHLLALAFGETVRDLLDSGMVGSRHGVAAHVTVTVDAARYAAGLGGDLVVAGLDEPVPLAPATIQRILCDSSVTSVLTSPPAGCAGSSSLGDLLRRASRSVLYVGRAQRTVPPRLRRALEARDQHCAFPECRASVHRCHAHHVQEWVRDQGPTDVDNLVLLCSRHHHVVHEGGWTISTAPAGDPTTSGYWSFDPPRPRP